MLIGNRSRPVALVIQGALLLCVGVVGTLGGTRINDPLPPGEIGVERFALSPADFVVAFGADMDGDGDREFYVAVGDGSGSPQLINAEPAGGCWRGALPAGDSGFVRVRDTSPP